MYSKYLEILVVEGKGFGPSPSQLSAYFAEISRRQTALECPLEPFRVPIRPHFRWPGARRFRVPASSQSQTQNRSSHYLRPCLSARQDEARGTHAPPTAFDRSLP